MTKGGRAVDLMPLLLYSCLISMALSGCLTTSSSGAPPVASGSGPDSYWAGQGLGWADLRFIVPRGPAQLEFVVQADYAEQADWPIAYHAFIGANVTGTVIDADTAEMSAFILRSPDEDAFLEASLAGRSIKQPLPADAPRLDAAMQEGNRFEFQILDLADRCGIVVAPGGMCHVYLILANGSADAPFRIWVNATSVQYALTHGYSADTFAYTYRDYEKAAGSSYGLGDARGTVGTDLRLEANLGDAARQLVFVLRQNTNAASVGVSPEVGESWYQRPNGERVLVQGGNAIEVATAGGNWVFGLDSRSGAVRADDTNLWGASMTPALVVQDA